MKKKYKCPYCFHPFNREEATFQIANQVQEWYCPNTEEDPDTDRLKCGKKLPHLFLEAKSKVIAFSGGVNAGKTCYSIALLVQIMTNKALWEMGISGDLIGSQKAKDNFYAILKSLKEGDDVPATIFESDPEPLLLKILIDDKKGSSKHVYLSLFDNSGELFAKTERSPRDLSNIYNADAVLYLFEPKQIRAFWDKINTPYSQRVTPADLYSTLTNVVTFMEAYDQRGYRNDRAVNDMTAMDWLRRVGNIRNKISVPIGLAMSKIDQVEDLLSIDIPADEEDLRMYFREGVLDEWIIDQISQDLGRVIHESDPRIQSVVQNIHSHKFFGIQSITVDKEGNPVNLNSRGVLLPLIWLLKELKLY